MGDGSAGSRDASGGRRDHAPVAIERTGLDGDEAALRDLLTAYYREIDPRARARFDELSGIDVGRAVDADVARLADPDPAEPLVVARTDGDLVGSVQLKRIDPASAEVKRLYVAPEYRGRGVGRDLMETLVDGARADGFATLRLGVAPFLDRASALYRALGFESTDRYDASNAPEAVEDEWGFMRLDLDDGGSTDGAPR